MQYQSEIQLLSAKIDGMMQSLLKDSHHVFVGGESSPRERSLASSSGYQHSANGGSSKGSKSSSGNSGSGSGTNLLARVEELENLLRQQMRPQGSERVAGGSSSPSKQHQWRSHDGGSEDKRDGDGEEEGEAPLDNSGIFLSRYQDGGSSPGDAVRKSRTQEQAAWVVPPSRQPTSYRGAGVVSSNQAHQAFRPSELFQVCRTIFPNVTWGRWSLRLDTLTVMLPAAYPR